MVPATAYRVLVVVPTLGQRLAELERALASIASQKDVGVDIVVVTPNGEAPSLAELVHRQGARLLVEPGHISAAVNRGFAAAGDEHRYVAWMGDDDLLRPGALAMSSSLLERNPSAVIAFGRCDYIDLAGQLLFTRRPPAGAAFWLQFVPGLIKQEACLFRRSALVKAGRLDENLRYAMDLDILLRLRQYGPFVRTEAVLAAFCWHPGSITIANRAKSLAEAQAVQRRLAQGPARLIGPLTRPVFRFLLSMASAQINRRHLKGV